MEDGRRKIEDCLRLQSPIGHLPSSRGCQAVLITIRIGSTHDIPMKKYNVGIIGYGWVSGAHIAAINATSQAQVTAVYSSRRLDSTELNARHHCQLTCYNDLDALLAEKNIHAVSICSYPYEHAKHAIAAAKAHKHLIIEKPLALTWEDCEKIREAV